MIDKSIKCIYCNSEQNLTDSDIIPYSLTGAKLHKKFVCGKHNAFTNDNYENDWINALSVFRKLLGFTTREGKSVTYNATVSIGDIEIEDKKFSDVSAMLENKKRLYRVKGNDDIRFGNIEKISEIAEKHGGEVSDVDLSSLDISATISSEEFASCSVLHAIAKIGYESHCYYNNVNELDKELYGGIVDYILNPNDSSCMVEIITDSKIYGLFDKLAIYGTNSIFEYDGENGYRYVIFGLWNVLFYKIKICKSRLSEINNICTIHLFHPDGEINEAIIKVRNIVSKNAIDALNEMYPVISKRLECLYQPCFSYKSLASRKKRFEENIDELKSGKMSIYQFLEIGMIATISYVYMFEFLLQNRERYNGKISFIDNLHLLIGNDNIILLPDINKLITRYMTMFENGEFIEMLEKSFSFFDSISE